MRYGTAKQYAIFACVVHIYRVFWFIIFNVSCVFRNCFSFFRRLSLEGALDTLEEMSEVDNNGYPINVHALYIEPPDNDDELSGEDDGDDSGGSPDNVCAGQLKANCELVFEDGHRINSLDDFDDYGGIEFTHIHDEELLANILNAQIVFENQTEQPSTPTTPPPRKRLCRVQSVSSDAVIPESNKNTKFVWEKDTASSSIPMFPDANYEDCKGLKAHEQFEKFFDDCLLQHICDCSAIYANYRNRPHPNITIDGNSKIFASI